MGEARNDTRSDACRIGSRFAGRTASRNRGYAFVATEPEHRVFTKRQGLHRDETGLWWQGLSQGSRRRANRPLGEPHWHRAVFVSDDGRHLVKCYGGLNLVPLDYDPDMSLVEVWRQGAFIHRLSLRAVFRNPSAMPRTVSHYAWGGCLRFESETRFVIALEGYGANGDLIWKKAVLNVMSGQLMRTNELIRR